jgi:type II secretion system protein N
MAEKKTSLWKRIVGYSAFALFALVTTFFLTFPYDTLKDTIRTAALGQGYALRIGSLGPGLLAVRASKVEVSKVLADPPQGAPAAAKDAPPPVPLMVDSVSIGPTFFPPGVAVKLNLLGGDITGRVSGLSGTRRVRVDVEDLDLAKGNLKASSGIDLSGEIEAHLDLSIPLVNGAPGAPAEADLAQASGSMSLETKALAINGGTANITIAQFGPDPTPVDLPKILLGELIGKVKIDKGAATIEEFKSKSPDLEINIGGTIKLAKRLEYAEPTMEVRVKPDPEFQKRLGLLGSALSMIGADPKDPTWRLGRLTGYLGRPQFR